MAKSSGLFSNEALSKTVYICLSVLVLAFVYLLVSLNTQIFVRFLGSSDPMLVFLAVCFTGYMFLTYLRKKKHFDIFRTEITWRKRSIPILTAMVFLPVSITVDSVVGFSAEINILFPHSLFFYPAMAFLVEIIFHVLPLCIPILGFSFLPIKVNYQNLLWGAIAVISLLEPTFQVLDMDSFPIWAIILVWVNLYAFNLVQLWIFSKFDFITMLLFRWVYYLFWHILWGYFRLDWIF